MAQLDHVRGKPSHTASKRAFWCPLLKHQQAPRTNKYLRIAFNCKIGRQSQQVKIVRKQRLYKQKKISKLSSEREKIDT